MKKTLLFLVMLTMFGSVAFARRLDNPAASTRMAIVRSGSTFKVFYNSTSISKVTVTIYDANDYIVFSDNLGKLDNFVRPYNFSDLPEGEYTIELSDAAGKQVERVEFRRDKIETVAKLIKVTGEDSKFILLVPSKNEDVISVKILNDGGEVVYQEEEKLNGNFAKVYDLKAVSASFTFVITDKNGVAKTIRY